MYRQSRCWEKIPNANQIPPTKRKICYAKARGVNLELAFFDLLALPPNVNDVQVDMLPSQ